MIKNKYLIKLAEGRDSPDSVIYTTFKGETEPEMLMHEGHEVYSSKKGLEGAKSRNALAAIRARSKNSQPVSDAVFKANKPSILSVVKKKLGLGGSSSVRGIGRTLRRF